MRLFLAALIALLLGLNYLLWMVDDRGIRQVRALEAAIEAQKADNAALADRNRALEAEVRDLKEGLAAVEERARADLGMVRRDETFFRILDEAPKAAPVQAKPGQPAPPSKPGQAKPAPRTAAPEPGR